MDAALKDEERAALVAQLTAAQREVARLRRQLDDTFALVDAYGAAQWRRGNGGADPQDFIEWRKEMGA